MDRIIRTTLALTADLIEATEIDAAFAAMADDDEYQSQALMISDEFAIADWEAFQLGESQKSGEGKFMMLVWLLLRVRQQTGIRPVIIVSRDAINVSSPVVLAVPCPPYRPGKRIYRSSSTFAIA